MSVVSPPQPVRTAPPERAARLRRPSWRDSRLLVGVLIVAAAVAVGSRVVAAADDTVGVYAVRSTLPAGTALSPEDVMVERVRLSSGTAGYLAATGPVPSGQVLLRTVGAGELLPRSAVGDAAALRRRPVSIPLDGVAPSGLTAGSLVDVWVSARASRNAGAGFRPPERLAERAEVFHVDAPGTGLTAGREVTVQVLLGPGELTAVLDAQANEARIALVPLPGSGPPGRSR